MERREGKGEERRRKRRKEKVNVPPMLEADGRQ